MSTFDGMVRFRPELLIFACLVSCTAYAQSGVPFQLDEVEGQVARIESGLTALEETVEEIVLVERSRCDRPVSWNRKIPDTERFAAALNGHAYCDLETGLVWAETPIQDALYWTQANDRCRDAEIDGRRGWHLPAVEELQSLIDESNSFPALPTGHPFVGDLSGLFFTSSPDEDSVYGQFREVWLIDMGGGVALTSDVGDPPFTDTQARAWCVRGGVNPLPIADVNFEGDEIGG